MSHTLILDLLTARPREISETYTVLPPREKLTVLGTWSTSCGKSTSDEVSVEQKMLTCNLHCPNLEGCRSHFKSILENVCRCVGWDRVPLTKTPEKPAMPSNEKEGKRVDSGPKLSWRCFSGLGLSWCITDGPPTEAWGL